MFVGIGDVGRNEKVKTTGKIGTGATFGAALPSDGLAMQGNGRSITHARGSPHQAG